MSRTAADHSVRPEHAQRRLRPHGPAHARRVSGPMHPQGAPQSADGRALATNQPAFAPPGVRRRLPARPPLRLAAGGAAIALRVAESAMEASGSRTMDRLVRSRAWVVIVGVGLIGIVAMQVSLLKLNAGISAAVDTVATLERSNASMKAEVSRLSAGDRIQTLAGDRGLLMPEPADVSYLTAGTLHETSQRAARRMRAPNPEIAGPAGSLLSEVPPELSGATAPEVNPTGAAATAATATPATGAAPAGTTPSGTRTGTAPATTANGAPAAATSAPATTAPAASDPSATTPPSRPSAANGPATPASVPAPTATSAGGVTP